MSKTSSNSVSKFAYVYIRPGIDGKTHPIGTVAIKLEQTAPNTYQFGIAMQNTKKDRWVASIGRSVAAGRADRIKDPMSITVETSSKIKRSQLIMCVLDSILVSATKDKNMMSKQFRRAIGDTLYRIHKAQ